MVKIRLKRLGTKARPFYRIVAIESRNQRDGKALEILGHFNPLTEHEDGLVIHYDKVKSWYDKGARYTPAVGKLLRKRGLLKNLVTKSS